MTTIKGHCPTCGDITGLAIEAVTLRVCADDGRGSYWFRCPTCSFTVAKEVSPRMQALLLSSGCPLQVWRFPAELHDPDRCGAPLSSDDILNLHIALETVEYGQAPRAGDP